ncbi:DUF3883 domain-containing protein [Marinobacter sp. MIT932201]|uniref:DUF3883 domain-containing protein n=1 Tax=Marinobacter sp. MIT932201 TaxID=3096995 RepID=UPI00399C4397
MSLLNYEKRFSMLRLNSGGANKSPHKVAMLQAVMDLIESGEVEHNRLYFDDNLKSHFTKRFQEFASPSDRNNPHLPYFHLRSEGFWHFKAKAGQQESYEQLTTATSPGVINAHIDHAFLDDELFELMTNQVARELLRSALLVNLDDTSIRELLKPERGGWDWLECEFLVNEYVTMLEKELAGAKYNKSAHRRALQPRLNGRSERSIEDKHQNVSAVLLELGLPYIPGYKPYFNYQKQLKSVVLSYLAGHQKLVEDLHVVADTVADEPEYYDRGWNSVFDPEPPERIPHVDEIRPSYLARHVDFPERERRNRQLGERAEGFVLRMERQRLTAQGRPDLAAEVEWSSKDRGDGLGFDIRSFDSTGDQERFLEVKATNSGKYLPFFISENERAFSNDYSDSFLLYRVYEFTTAPRLFILPGAIEQHVHLMPQNYRARF